MTFRPRCLWPGCPHQQIGREPYQVYCYQHFPALGIELQGRLRLSVGTPEWVPAIQACQDHARASVAWVKHNVKGGHYGEADSHAKGG